MSTYLPNPSVAPLVADFGSFSTKLGFAGEDHPSAIYHSSTAALRNDASQPARLASPPRRDFVTRTLESQDDGDYTIVNPVDATTGWLYSRPGQCASSSSLCSNDTTAPSDSWESFELLNHYMSHSFNYLGIENRASHPLIMLDKSHTPPPLRQRMIEVLFEQNSLPAVFLLRDAIAACYAVGRTTATVVDCGYSSTTVTPVYEGFVERRGIRRNNACGAKDVEEQILQMMDGLVAGAGRKRKDRLKRINAKKMMAEGGAGMGGEQLSPSKHKKRDSSGHFVKRSSMVNEYPIPDYLMPIYQVRRAPLYNTRKDEFHNWSRMALARELKEGGLGAAVGSMGYVSSQAGGEGNTSNSMFMTSNKVPYTLPDGTNVEITANARCDVAELYFGNDQYNTAYRERVLDETKAKLDEYVTEVDEYCNAWEPSEDDKKALASAGNAPGAGDAFSTTSYRGEKSSKHGGRRARSATYSPATISAKLFSACLPYLRTAPPKSSADPMDAGGTGSTTSTTLDDERCFNYLTSVPPAQMVCDSAFRCDRDQQGALLGNVVVCGGGACLPGIGGALGAPGVAAAGSLGQLNEDAFPDRLREEIEAIVHQHTLGWRVKVTSPNMTERSICSWLGGSILGSLGTFQDMWISKQDYEEYGSAIVNRKCP